MIENNSTTENRKEKIKCSNCGNEDTFILISETDSANSKTHLNQLQNKIQTTEKQKYLAHYFEAQRRFSE